MDVTITGQKLLRTLDKEFQGQFPYLGLRFLSPQEWEKAQNNASTVSTLDHDQRLSAVRTIPPAKGEKEMSIHGRTLVKNLEEKFAKTYGIHLQVIYQKDDKLYYTAGGKDEMSLTQLNKYLEENGYTKNPGSR